MLKIIKIKKLVAFSITFILIIETIIKVINNVLQTAFLYYVLYIEYLI